MRFNRDSLAALVASAVVVLVIVLGFWKTHGPSTQRLVRADEKRLQNVSQLANEIHNFYKLHDKQLPSALDDSQKKRFADPFSGKPPEYSQRSATGYTLCATFATNTSQDERGTNFIFWTHPAGHKCIDFNATEPVPQAPYFYY
jgi:hypothetical protein